MSMGQLNCMELITIHQANSSSGLLLHPLCCLITIEVACEFEWGYCSKYNILCYYSNLMYIRSNHSSSRLQLILYSVL